MPPRPQLSYPIEQRREIVERLIGDHALARYTDQRIRYEAGISSLPPPPEPPAAAALQQAASEQAARTVAATPSALPPAQEPGLEDGNDSALGNDPQLDDDTLGDFMQDLVRDTAPAEAPPTGVVAPPSEARSEGTEGEADAAEPTAGGESDGLAGHLLGWIGGLFGGERSTPGPGAPEARSERRQPGASDAPGTDAEPPAVDDRHAMARPTPKPALIASPPQPAAKPQIVARAAVPFMGAETALGAIAFAPGSDALPEGAAAALTRAAAAAAPDGARIEVHAMAADRALAIDRGRAVALALMEIGVTLDRIDLLVEDGPDQARLVLAGHSS